MKKHAAYKIQNTNYRTEKHQEKTDKNKHFSFLVRRAVSIPQIRYAAAAAVFKSSTAHSNNW